MAAVAIPAVLSGIGILSANEQARKQRNMQEQALQQQQQGLDKANESQKPVTEALYEMLRLARGYDPGRETDIAVQRAADVTEHSLDRALRGLDARYRTGGGTPGLSSEFNVQARGLTDRVTDPLREFVANQRVNEFAKRMAAFQAVNGGNTGNLASNYFQAAQNSANMSQMFQPQYGASLSLLGNALQNLFNKPGGAGGTGDLRSTVKTTSNGAGYGLLGSGDYMNYQSPLSSLGSALKDLRY